MRKAIRQYASIVPSLSEGLFDPHKYVMIKIRFRNKQLIDTPLNTKVLNMSHNRLKVLDIRTSAPLKYLLRIDVSDNLITEFHVNMSSMRNLEYLDLSNNNLSALSSTTISQLNDIAGASDKQNLTIDIGGNNLRCTCDTKDFVEWVLQSHSTNIRFVNMDTYKCTDSDSKQIVLQELSVFASLGCYWSYYKQYILRVLIVTCIAVICVIMFCVYKLRFRLRYLCYKICKKFKRTQHTAYNQQHTYDAFICFDRADSKWIDSKVKARLEHLKIRYGEEDIEPGQDIPDAISQYIRESRRSILVLSPDFVNPQRRPNFNMHYARMIRDKLMNTGNDIVIIVELKSLKDVGLDITLTELMEHHLCLKWDEQEQDIFWEWLVDALQAPCEELYDIPERDTNRLLHV